MGDERETLHAEPTAVAVPEAVPIALAPGPIPAGFGPDTILSLQRTAGNQAVTRYLARQSAGAPAPSQTPAAAVPPSGPAGLGKAQEIAYEIPRKPVPGSPFAIAGKIQVSVALSGAPVKGQSGSTEVTVAGFKDEEVKQRGQKWLRAFAATLAKLEWTAAEPIPGVKVSGSIELLEAKLEAGEDVDVSLVKAVAEISGDLIKIAASTGGAGELQPLVDRGAEIKVSGVVEITLDPTAASHLAKAQASKVRAEKLAEETAELAEKNKGAARKLQQQIASRDAALKRGKVRGKGGRLRALSKADRAKIAKEIADRKAELGKLKDALKAKEAAAKVAKSEMDEAMAGLSKGIGKRWGEAIKKALGKRLLKLAGALGILMTAIDIAIFVHAVAKAGIDPGFHDKGDSGTPGGDPNAAPAEGGGGADASAGAGGGGEYDIDADGGLSDEERVDVTETPTAALHPAAQQLVEALYGEDPGAKVSPGQLEVFNQIVPQDLTPEEVELIIQRVKGAGADAGGIQISVIKAVREVRDRQTISEPEAAPPGGAAPGKVGTGPSTGDQPGPMQTPDGPAESKPGEKVLDVRLLEFRVVGGIDPDKRYAAGQSVTMSIVVTHDVETLPVTFPARVVSQTQTDTEDVFTLENISEWRKARRDGVEIFMSAGTLFSTRWARQGAPAAAP
jgi:hypothetical protein